MSSTRPNPRPKILAIDGSYRRGGITDQLVDAVLNAAEADGARTERVHLIDERIAFCRNCRACAAEPLDSAAVRGACQLDDAMAPLLARIDAADGLVLAAPIGSVANWRSGQRPPRPRALGDPLIIVLEAGLWLAAEAAAHMPQTSEACFP